MLVRSGYREVMGFSGNRSNINRWPNKVVHPREGVVNVGSLDYLGWIGHNQVRSNQRRFESAVNREPVCGVETPT
jgi:hypothetical protein